MSTASSRSNYRILFTQDAADDVSELDGSIKKRLKRVLTEKLASDPEGYGTQLRAPLAEYWKHQFASHRILYRIFPDERVVVICAVGSRRGEHATDVYSLFEAVASTGKVAEQVARVLHFAVKPKK